MGFLVEVDGPRQRDMAVQVDPEAGDGDGDGVAKEFVTRDDGGHARNSPLVRVGSNGLDPLTNALGYWSWMLDHGYDPITGEFPTRVS